MKGLLYLIENLCWFLLGASLALFAMNSSFSVTDNGNGSGTVQIVIANRPE